MTQQDILDKLKEGNKRFTTDSMIHGMQDAARRGDLTGGQQPWAIILSCADSRVAPELAFDTGLGELFVIRVAGNVANTSSIASIEYAVAHLGTQVIVVLGHQSCGAVTAAAAGGNNGYNLNHLLSHITPAVAASPEGTAIDDIVRTNAKNNAQDLMDRSSIIKDAVDAGKVKIVPAFYHLTNGQVDFL